jgi:hypothetical protein
MSLSNTGVQLPKYQQVLESIKNDILSGRYQPGHKAAERSGFGEAVWNIEDHCGARPSRIAAGGAGSKPRRVRKVRGNRRLR